jgi:hypothetical protein
MNSENGEPVARPTAATGECREPNPHGDVVCRRPRGHAGGHVDSNGLYWQRHDSDLDAALTPPGYSLPAGELTSEPVQP